MRTPLLVAVVSALAACARPTTNVVAARATMDAAALREPRELLPEQQVQHVLNRLAFGPRPGDVEQVRAMGVDRWIARQLAPERIEDKGTSDLLSRYETLSASTPDLVSAFRTVQQARRRELQTKNAEGDSITKREARREVFRDDPELRERARRVQRMVSDLQSAKLARAVSSERQLQEVLVDFWENHFSVFAGKGQTRLFLTEYDRDIIRPRAFGKFRDLLGAVAQSPAMLFFLDNFQSAADSTRPTLARRPRVGPRARGLNENYARELMELHTLGVDGGYTQTDVIEVARALTGWTIDLRTGAFVFRPALHDAGSKSVLGHRLPAGRGIEDGNDVLDIVARHPSTARFITTKLARRFVSDSVSPALVDRCAGVFRTTDGDIRETVRCVVTSPEFFSRAAFHAKVKSPFEVVASALRVVGAEPDSTPRSAQMVARLGQPIFGRQTPDGWPDRGDAWMNTGAILNRINFGLALAAGRMPGASLDRWPAAVSLRTATRPQQVVGVITALLGGEASQETRTILLSGDNPMLSKLAGASDSTMTAPDPGVDDMASMSPPDRDRQVAANKKGQLRPGAMRAMDRPVNLDGLAQVVGLALGSPEFQRK